MKNVFLLAGLSLLLFACNSVKSLSATAYTVHGEPPAYLKQVFQNYGRVSDKLNHEVKNLSVTVDKDKGLLQIHFDYPSGLWFKGYPKGMGLLVRVFDKNGNVLTYFTTREQYLPQKMAAKWKSKRDPASLIGLGALVNPQGAFGYLVDAATIMNPTGNQLSYSINLKDAEYAEAAEVGFVDTGLAARVEFE